MNSSRTAVAEGKMNPKHSFIHACIQSFIQQLALYTRSIRDTMFPFLSTLLKAIINKCK